MPTISLYVNDESYLRYLKNRSYWNSKLQDTFKIVKDDEIIDSAKTPFISDLLNDE